MLMGGGQGAGGGDGRVGTGASMKPPHPTPSRMTIGFVFCVIAPTVFQ